MAAFSSATLATVDLLGAGRSPLEPIGVRGRTSALSVFLPGCPFAARKCRESVLWESQSRGISQLVARCVAQPARAVHLGAQGGHPLAQLAVGGDHQPAALRRGRDQLDHRVVAGAGGGRPPVRRRCRARPGPRPRPPAPPRPARPARAGRPVRGHRGQASRAAGPPRRRGPATSRPGGSPTTLAPSTISSGFVIHTAQPATTGRRRTDATPQRRPVATCGVCRGERRVAPGDRAAPDCGGQT